MDQILKFESEDQTTDIDIDTDDVYANTSTRITNMQLYEAINDMEDFVPRKSKSGSTLPPMSEYDVMESKDIIIEEQEGNFHILSISDTPGYAPRPSGQYGFDGPPAFVEKAAENGNWETDIVPNADSSLHYAVEPIRSDQGIDIADSPPAVVAVAVNEANEYMNNDVVNGGVQSEAPPMDQSIYSTMDTPVANVRQDSELARAWEPSISQDAEVYYSEIPDGQPPSMTQQAHTSDEVYSYDNETTLTKPSAAGLYANETMLTDMSDTTYANDGVIVGDAAMQAYENLGGNTNTLPSDRNTDQSFYAVADS